MKIAPLVLILLAACSSATAHAPGRDTPPDDPLPHLIGFGTAGTAAEGLDAATLAEAPDAAAGALDASEGLDAATLAEALDAARAGGLDAGPDAGGLDAAAPLPNACGGLGAITCTRPPCKPGAQCATVAGCNANVCVDCPGADIQCSESQCGGSWSWECAGANVLRCTNGRFTCG